MKPRTVQALKLIVNEKPKSYKEFARKFWPNHPMHTRVTNCGNGATGGAVARLCAGSFLRKLERQGLIKFRWHDESNLLPLVYLTKKGIEFLIEFLEVK